MCVSLPSVSATPDISPKISSECPVTPDTLPDPENATQGRISKKDAWWKHGVIIEESYHAALAVSPGPEIRQHLSSVPTLKSDTKMAGLSVVLGNRKMRTNEGLLSS